MYLLIYILVIAAVLAVSYRRPAVAFSFMLCTFGFEQWLQSKDVFFVVNSSLVNIVSGIVVLYALMIKVKKNGNIIKDYPTEAYLILLLYFYAFVSVLWSPVPEISSDNAFQLSPYILLMTVLSPLLINDKEDIYDALVFMILFGGGLSVLLLFFTEWGYRTIVLAVTGFNVKTNPLAIANLAGYVLLASVLLNLKNKSKLWLLVRVFLLVISLAIAVKTGSRGQFLLMLIVSLVFLPVSRQINRIKRLVPLLITVAFTLVIAYWAMSEFIGEDTRWDMSRMENDVGGRYDAAFRLIERWYSSAGNLLFGLGSSASYDPSIFGFYTHIVPMEIIGELGAFGFLIYLSILYLTFKKSRISLKKIGDDMLKKGAFAALSGLVVFEFLLSFKQGSFLGSSIFFGLLVALARYNKSLRNEIKSEKSENFDKVKDDVFSKTNTSGVKLR
ncbi:hypothetical protein MNBD_GAMMA11-232 [hydrothermal vent metagenome]|uniref:Uncharacterized protein n=1 Tax=hydrothermal vent metagenome TaxID=652676 RepID=A0A3B0X364_9ZZZZ